jgi:UDP-2,4-diacetamido-2,4,6-trideoxy-beta-L-altropyranose hydrolase
VVDAQVAVVADTGERAGLGHLSRCRGIAAALLTRGTEPVCFALGAEQPASYDGLVWRPVQQLEQIPRASAAVVLLDSYDITARQAVEYFSDRPVAVFDDTATADDSSAALTIDLGGSDDGRPRRAVGLRYACLQPEFWGMPAARPRARVERVLVTIGGGGSDQAAKAILAAVRAGAPDAAITLVQGPYARFPPLDGVRLLRAPAGLRDELMDADLVVCAAGLTMLEGAAIGVPCVAVALVENQHRQAQRLHEQGGVSLVRSTYPGHQPPVAESCAAVAALSLDHDLRAELSRRAQAAVDGYGALRVAFLLQKLIEAES